MTAKEKNTRDFNRSNLIKEFKSLCHKTHEKSWNSRNTYRKSTVIILKYVYETFNVQKIANISKKHIISYIDSTDKSLATLKKEISGFRYYVDLVNKLNSPKGKNSCKFTNVKNQEIGIHDKKAFYEKLQASNSEINKLVDICNDFKDESTGDVLKYAILTSAAFGLRSREIFSLEIDKIKFANKQIENGEKAFLKLTTGTKGGRPRNIPIESEYQKKLIRQIYINFASKKCNGDCVFRDKSVPHSLQSRLNLWHNFFSKNGESVADDERKIVESIPRVSAHDLRRHYANSSYNRYRKLGYSPSISFAKTSENLGHGFSRFDIAKSYFSAEIVSEIKTDKKLS